MTISEDSLVNSVEKPNLIPLLKKNKGIKLYNNKGIIAYQEGPFNLIVATDPWPHEQSSKIKLFEDFLTDKGANKRISGYYFTSEFAFELQKHHQYVTYKIGESHFVEIQKFHLQGRKARDIRRALNYGHKNQYEFQEIVHLQKKGYLTDIRDLERKWLKAKVGYRLFGRIGFLLSRVGKGFKDECGSRWFVVKKNQRVISFVCLGELDSSESGPDRYYLENMIFDPGNGKFAMDFLLANVLKKLKEEGVKELYLGLCPFSNIPQKSFFELVLSRFYSLKLFYDAKGLDHFKSKYSNRTEARYLIIKDRVIFSLFDLFTATFPRFSSFWFGPKC